MIRRITALPAVALAITLLTPAAAAAHASLSSTNPADGEELTTPPDEVVMVFDGELDPEASSFVVTDAAGNEVGAGEVDLQVAERNEMRGAIEISDPGEYTVRWTSAAADGHPEQGTFTFSVAGDVTGEAGGTPNTAIGSGQAPGAPTLIGLTLVGCAIVLGLRRLVGVRA